MYNKHCIVKSIYFLLNSKEKKMKKLLVLFMTIVLCASLFVACTPAADGNNDETTAGDDTTVADDTTAGDDTTAEPDDTQPADPAAKPEGVMTYAEYAAAEMDAEVVIEAYVQAKQVWNSEYQNGSLYLADPDGAYFVYRIACGEETYNKLEKGTKVSVTGYKSEWSGEIEITDASLEILEGNWIAETKDVTALLGSDDLINSQNQYVSFKGMTVAASTDADGNEVAFLYGWDGSGQDGSDLYFNVSINDSTYNFVVESDLCDSSSDVYAAVKALNIGDKIDLEGFLYWYEGANPHITAVKAAE